MLMIVRFGVFKQFIISVKTEKRLYMNDICNEVVEEGFL